MTQTAQILAHLKSGKILTNQSAVRLFDCYRLAARVHDLKKQGHRIEGTVVRLKSGKRAAVYSIDRHSR